MTTEELTVGLEMDTRVAREVLGLTVEESKGVLYAYTQGARAAVELPPYSTDWNAAAQVIDRLTDQDWKLNIYTRGKQWEVVLYHVGINMEEHFADTLPEAICRAALRGMAALNGRNPTLAATR